MFVCLGKDTYILYAKSNIYQAIKMKSLESIDLEVKANYLSLPSRVVDLTWQSRPALLERNTFQINVWRSTTFDE
jgi:hypothetical protein